MLSRTYAGTRLAAIARVRPLLFVAATVWVAMGCGDPVPPSTALATTPRPAAITIAGDQVYWSAADQIHRMPLAGGQRESMPALRAAQIVVTLDALYWRSQTSDAFFDNSRLMVTDAAGTREVPFLDYANVTPLGTDRTGALYATGYSTATGRPVLIHRRVEGLSTTTGWYDGELWRAFFVDDPNGPAVLMQYGLNGSAMITGYGVAQGMGASGIRRAGGMAYAAGRLYWVDGNYLGRTGELYRKVTANGSPELLVELPDDVSGPWLAAGRLWLLPWSETGGTTLVSVDPETGEEKHYDLDHAPDAWTLAMTDAGFVSWDGDQLRWQPLP